MLSKLYITFTTATYLSIKNLLESNTIPSKKLLIILAEYFYNFLFDSYVMGEKKKKIVTPLFIFIFSCSIEHTTRF